MHSEALWDMKHALATSHIQNKLIGGRTRTVFCALRVLITMQ